MKISKNKKKAVFFMSQGSLNPKIKFLCQKVCTVARVRTHTDRQTDTQTDTKVTTFLFLQPIIKDRPKKRSHIY